MKDISMGVLETQFANIIWEKEPISSTQLSKISEIEIGWKKTTSYTVLKRLCEKGIFQNQRGQVTSLISKDQFYSMQSEKFVEETFDGSLPAFLAAFTSRKKLTESELEQLKRMINEFDEE
ncbi:MAG: BlaI/MecI/CopY family transcriptional regulator [Clostridia bacterium]